MVALPLPSDPTLDAIDAALIEHNKAEARRPYLGASQIGQPCERALWYSFRWCYTQEFDGPTLRRFDDGFRVEDVMAARLRMVPGVELHTLDPNNGKQFGIVSQYGHFRGHLDGAIAGIKQAPRTWHVWECKAVNDEKFAKLGKLKNEKGEKETLKLWDQVYYGQAQIYMHYTGMQRHYLTVTTPGARQMDSARTDYSKTDAEALEAKAGRIIASTRPLARMSDDPAWYQCKWCPAHDLCHGNKVARVNCRTCAHSTPVMEGQTGQWRCEFHKTPITTEQQERGCDSHRFIPDLVPHSTVVDADPVANWIEYEVKETGKRYRNGDPAHACYPSEELRNAAPSLIGDEFVDAMRSDLGARFAEPLPQNDWSRGAVNWSKSA